MAISGPRRPRPPRSPNFRILPKRSRQSEELDEKLPGIPFVAWPVFASEYPMGVGEHITLIGKTKSGKTTLTLGGILPQFPYVVVLGTKDQDPKLYNPLLAAGYKMTRDPRLNAQKTPRAVFRSKVRGLTADVHAQQKDEYGRLLSIVYAELGWAVYIDELAYITDTLNLRKNLETLWLQGSSEGITMIASTQEPANVPLVAFGQISHLFVFKMSDQYRIDRVAEIAGADKRTMRYVISSLADHEVLYVRTADDVFVRTVYIP